MKVPIIILAFLGLVCGKPLPSGRLQDELNDFLVLVPTDKILEIALDYLANDTEVKELVVYIQSEEFPKIHRVVEYLKEYKDCFKYFTDDGVDIYAITNKIRYILGLHPFEPTNSTRTGVGIQGLIDDVIAVLPLDDLKALFYKKMETHEYFKVLFSVIQYPEFKQMVEIVRSWPVYQTLLETLKEGVYMDHLMEIRMALTDLFRRGTHILKDELKELKPLIPIEKFFEIAMDYLTYDQELQEFIVYIQSEEFPKIHRVVEYLKKYKDCFKFITDDGVDVYAIVTKIHDILGLPTFEPTNSTRTGVGIYGLIDDVIAVLPLDDMKALFEKKMETREYLKTLVTVLHSPEFKTMVDTVRTWPVYQKLLERLQEYVVYVKHILEPYHG